MKRDLTWMARRLFQRIPSPLWMGGLYLAARWALFPFSPIPAAVPLDPLWVFLAARGGGRRWVLGAALLPGLVAGDVLAGLPWEGVATRAAGLAVVLWTSPEARFHTRFLHAMCVQGLWSSLAPDWLGVYPVSYLYLAWCAQGVLWWGLTAPRLGGGRVSHAWLWLPLPLGVGAAHGLLGGPELWPLPRPGFGSGWPLALTATFLALACPLWRAGRWGWAFWKRRGGKKRSAYKDLLWTDRREK